MTQYIGVDAALHLIDTLLRAEYARLVLFQFGRSKAFSICERLLAHIVRWNLVHFAATDLDIIAKDLVVSHSQRLDTAAFALARLQRCNPALRVVNGGDQFIQFRMEARADQPPIVLALILFTCACQRLIDQRPHLRAGIQRIGKFSQQQRITTAQQAL